MRFHTSRLANMTLWRKWWNHDINLLILYQFKVGISWNQTYNYVLTGSKLSKVLQIGDAVVGIDHFIVSGQRPVLDSWWWPPHLRKGYNGIIGEKGVVDTVRSWVGGDRAVAMGTVAALDLLSSSGSSEQCISSKSYVDEVGSGQCVSTGQQK